MNFNVLAYSSVNSNQLLDSESLKMFGGDDADAVEEFIALASESLSLFDADSNGKLASFGINYLGIGGISNDGVVRCLLVS